jgi:hypothetical protein
MRLLAVRGLRHWPWHSLTKRAYDSCRGHMISKMIVDELLQVGLLLIAPRRMRLIYILRIPAGKELLCSDGIRVPNVHRRSKHLNRIAYNNLRPRSLRDDK